MEIDTTKVLSYFLYFAGIFFILMRFIFPSFSEVGKNISFFIGFLFLVAGSWIYPIKREEILISNSEIKTTSKKGKLLAPNEMPQ